MTKRWKLVVFAAMNVVLPYAGSFAAGSLPLVAILPILVAYLLGFQRYDVLFDIVYIRHLWTISVVLSVGLILHSIWLLRQSRSHRRRYWPPLVFLAIAIAGIWFEDDRSYMLRVTTPAPEPFSTGTVVVARHDAYAVGDLVIGQDFEGASHIGVYAGAASEDPGLQKTGPCAAIHDLDPGGPTWLQVPGPTDGEARPLIAVRRVEELFLATKWIELPVSPEEACARP